MNKTINDVYRVFESRKNVMLEIYKMHEDCLIKETYENTQTSLNRSMEVIQAHIN